MNSQYPPALRVHDDPMVLRENARLQGIWNSDVTRRLNALDILSTLVQSPMQRFRTVVNYTDINTLGSSWPSPARLTIGTLPAGIGLYAVGARLLTVFTASSAPYSATVNVFVGNVAGADYFDAGIGLVISNDASPPTALTCYIPAKGVVPVEPQDTDGAARDLTSSVVLDITALDATPDLYNAGSLEVVIIYSAIWHAPV